MRPNPRMQPTRRHVGLCGRGHDRPQLMRISLGGANPARRSDVDGQRTSRDDAVVSTLRAAYLRTHERMVDVPLECE